MPKLFEIYLDYVNNYLTARKWAEDNYMTEESAIIILKLLKNEYNNYADLVGKQRTDC